MHCKAFKPLFLLAALTAGQAHAIVIDANLADWGIERTGHASDWLPNPGIENTIEDQNTSKLNPGYGGQAYDAEAMYTTIQGSSLYIALATGHSPLTLEKPSANSYGAGDFAIDFGKDGTYEVGINVKHRTPTGPESFGLEGGVYDNVRWGYGLWDEDGNHAPGNPDPLHPTYMTSGDYLGMATLQYTTSGATGYGQWSSHQHYFYEMKLDLGLLQSAGWDGSAFNIHWTENCANDSIIVASPGGSVPQSGGSVPEPGTLALLPLGLLGLVALRRRKPM